MTLPVFVFLFAWIGLGVSSGILISALERDRRMVEAAITGAVFAPIALAAAIATLIDGPLNKASARESVREKSVALAQDMAFDEAAQREVNEIAPSDA